ncbi:MAG: hypothetical protein CUN48_15535 [Candidatus Thermofonsia Clade 3 bacterium]|uniref:Uncharacterized protein n=1 Tax=Candidatus Thermofonsia Clade 3 bacterium TaxID=2364212 RepID=A0A2M8Q8G9_9CHLR|nr:MAG: hypothetical protein CUN48_15535 [Candidatus Thermofonsia Clade 3 bacterium]
MRKARQDALPPVPADQTPPDNLKTLSHVAYGLMATGIWWIYRIVRGWVSLSERRPMFSVDAGVVEASSS